MDRGYKIQYCSDLHLEFKENSRFIKSNPLIPVGDILILAGDILPFAMKKMHSNFFDFVSDNFEAVYWLPGNHEYYGYDMAEKNFVLFEEIRKNVFLVNNQNIQYKGISLFFSTLWGNITPAYEWEIRQTVSDFSVIRIDNRKFTPFDFSSLHNQCKLFLENAVKQNTSDKMVIITHHVPTLINYPEIYRNSPLNQAFAVELYDFIEQAGADYWIYGHHHFNIPAFTIGKTKLITNQLGYVQNDEHRDFVREAIIDFN